MLGIGRKLFRSPHALLFRILQHYRWRRDRGALSMTFAVVRRVLAVTVGPLVGVCGVAMATACGQTQTISQSDSGDAVDASDAADAECVYALADGAPRTCVADGKTRCLAVDGCNSCVCIAPGNSEPRLDLCTIRPCP